MIWIQRDWVRLMRWDRRAVVVSSAFNYVENSTRLLEFLRRLANSSPAQRGHDASVVLATRPEIDTLLRYEPRNRWERTYHEEMIQNLDIYPIRKVCTSFAYTVCRDVDVLSLPGHLSRGDAGQGRWWSWCGTGTCIPCWAASSRRSRALRERDKMLCGVRHGGTTPGLPQGLLVYTSPSAFRRECGIRYTEQGRGKKHCHRDLGRRCRRSPFRRDPGAHRPPSPSHRPRNVGTATGEPCRSARAPSCDARCTYRSVFSKIRSSYHNANFTLKPILTPTIKLTYCMATYPQPTS